MEKRGEKKKQNKKNRIKKLKFCLYVVLCFMFFLISISTVDNSTKKLLMDNSNKRAIYLFVNENIMNVELAGNQYEFNIEKIKNIIHAANDHLKIYYDELKDYINSKLEQHP